MTRNCDNCFRPVLDTDTVCWHCGRKLSPTAPATKKTGPIDVQEKQESALKPTPWPLIVFYGSLTLIIIVALMWLMNSLGQSPTLTGTGLTSTEWVALRDPDKQFSIIIPARWQWAFQGKSQVQLDFSPLVENESWAAAAPAPLGTLVPDSEYLLLAGNDSILLIVTRSERLNRLTPEQAVISLRQESFEGITIEDAHQKQNGVENNSAVFTIKHESPPMICRQLLTRDPTKTYLVAACTSINKDAQFVGEINAALDSFQLLSR